MPAAVGTIRAREREKMRWHRWFLDNTHPTPWISVDRVETSFEGWVWSIRSWRICDPIYLPLTSAVVPPMLKGVIEDAGRELWQELQFRVMIHHHRSSPHDRVGTTSRGPMLLGRRCPSSCPRTWTPVDARIAGHVTRAATIRGIIGQSRFGREHKCALAGRSYSAARQ